MGLYKLLAYIRATPGKVRKTFHRELGEPDTTTRILRCLSCNWGADYARDYIMSDKSSWLSVMDGWCPRCGGRLVEGER